MSDKPNTQFLDGCSTFVSTVFGAVVAALFNKLPPLVEMTNSGVGSTVILIGASVMALLALVALLPSSTLLPGVRNFSLALGYTFFAAILGAGLGLYIGAIELDSELLKQLLGVLILILMLLEFVKNFVDLVAKIPILNWLV